MTRLTLRSLADQLNAMPEGQTFRLPAYQIGEIALHPLRHNGGRDGFEQALRELLLGSSYGAWEFWWQEDPAGVCIKRFPCTEVATHDRDSYPIPGVDVRALRQPPLTRHHLPLDMDDDPPSLCRPRRSTFEAVVMTTTDPKFEALWMRIGRQQERNKERCAKMLVAGYGVKIIHPDDGWVNREKNILTPCYPILFDKSAAPGDLIALGSPDTDERVIGHYRIVRITEVHKLPLMLTLTGDHGLSYHFEPHVEQFEMTAPEQVA